MGTRGAPPPARAHLGRRETHTASNLGGGSSSAIATIGGLRRSLPTRNACAPRLQWGGGARRAGLPGRGGAFPEGRVVIGTVVPHIHVRLGRAGHGARLVWPEWRGRDPSPQRRVVIGTVLPHIHVRLGGSGQGPLSYGAKGTGVSSRRCSVAFNAEASPVTATPTVPARPNTAIATVAARRRLLVSVFMGALLLRV